MAESFGRTLYYASWTESGFPSSKRRQIGTGLADGVNGVERVFDLWDAVGDADLVVACDVYFHDVVDYLREAGKPVWGAGKAEGLETQRFATKRLMEALGMNVVPYKVVTGVAALWRYVTDREDQWIKGSVTRGDLETFHWVNEHVSAPRLEKLLRDLGPRRHTMEFLIEESLPGIEVGLDAYCVDGGFGNVCSWGYEKKDSGYLGRVGLFDDLPAVIREPTLELAPTMGQLGCRGFYSNEVRVAEDGTAYLTDPCLRCGSPPSESYIELFDNWAEVIWEGAHGNMVNLVPSTADDGKPYLFSAQIILKSSWVEDGEYLPVHFPPEIDRWVKLHNYCVMDGEYTVCPQEFPEFGSVIGLGTTQKEAEEAALEHAEQIEALEMEWEREAFDRLHETIEDGRKAGIHWD